MASPSTDDRDKSRYLSIGTDIRIASQEPTRISKRIEVRFNDERIELTHRGKEVQNGLITQRWTLGNEIRMFRDDVITLRMMRGKRRLWSKSRHGLPEVIKQEDITNELKEQGQAAISLVRHNLTIMMDVTTSDNLDRMDSSVPVGCLDDLLPERIEEFISSNELFFENVKKLRSVLEAISVTEDAWTMLERAIKTLGETLPLAKAVLTALSIPYNFLKRESDFNQNVKDFADVMHFTCKCLMDVRYHTKITSAKEVFISIMKTLRDAAVYISDYMSKGKINQLIAAQFPTKLKTYSKDLDTLRGDFQMAMVMQVAGDADKTASTVGLLASKEFDDTLRKQLGLNDSKEEPLGDGCLQDTRISVLREARNWLQNYDPRNVLWIVGAPGVGKSTIATTLARNPADTIRFCSKFFCKRDVEILRDPHRIWRTLAYGLARKHDGVKVALMRILEDKKCESQDYLITDQFEELIKGPLEVDLRTGSASEKSPYRLIIIDALDECYTANDNNRDWRNLLQTLGQWSGLSPFFKLIVTSRDVYDIRETLGRVSHRIDLSTGDNVSKESKQDIWTFFTQRFLEMKREHVSLQALSNWPEASHLQEMTDYAAGLFIWADMVVKYVGHRSGGSIPEERLEYVLNDIKPGNRGGGANVVEGSNQVDHLYARIIFEAFRDSNPPERKLAMRILATIVLATTPLRKGELVELLSTVASNSRYVLARIESTLQELSPIIPAVGPTDGLRVCHKTVSDFLLSPQRSKIAMEYVVREWRGRISTGRTYDPHSFVMNDEEENWNLALACIHVVRHYFAKDVDGFAGVLRQSSSALNYACHHWFKHIERAGARQVPDMSRLAKAMEIAFICLKEYRSQLMSLDEKAGALMWRFQDAVEFVRQCVDGETPAMDSMQELVQLAKALDVTRGHFQIAIVIHLTRDVEGSDKMIASDILLRKWLQPSDQTVLDSKCLEGTRTSVISEAKNWLEDPEPPNILWIFGNPGAGKSTVATTLVDEFRNTKLCAKVFAKRDFADRRDPVLMWRTLAYDLAGLHAGLKGSIMEALFSASRPKIDAKNQPWFHSLVVDALQHQQYLSVVVVIDALDECFSSDDNDKWRTLLQALADWHKLPGSFKLVVTSRDISDIRSALGDVCRPVCLTTGGAASLEEKGDIEKYLRTKLTDIPSVQLREGDLEELTEYAAGSFIWAKIVVGLVEKVGSVAPLKDILSGVQKGGDIDVLYGHLLSTTLGSLDIKRREMARSFLATLVLAKDPLRKSDLVKLALSSQSSADEGYQFVDRMVEDLSSIISVDDNELLRIPHKSFSDFLLDYDRSFEAMKQLLQSDHDLHSYLVDTEEDSAKLCTACLRLMDNSLKFNACGITTSYALNDGPLAEFGHFSESIPSTLIYACRFWAEHLKLCNYDDQQFRALAEPLLRTLLHKNLLSWLEILSLAKAVSSAVTSLEISASVIEEYGIDLVEVAKDGIRFVKTFEVPIAAAVPHIYLSALPFCPSGSCIARIYGPQYTSLLSVVQGRPMNWDTVSTTGDARSHMVTSVAFFPDGGRLASCIFDRAVRVWDVRKGGALSAPFTVNTNIVYSAAVSPDGNQIASGDENGTLRIWDSNTGACALGPIKGHKDYHPIRSVAFSPDGTRVVTSSQDNTVRVWNASTGDLCFDPLTGHTYDVISAVYSPDGTLIASCSLDKTIRIWDAHTGESRMEPLTEHTDFVLCVAFSPNGHYLASGSKDGTIRLWDASQRFSQIVATPVGSGILSLSFSPDSTCLVSGSRDSALRFWNVSSGGCEQIGVPIYGHDGVRESRAALFNGTSSVAFAPDGLSVASGGCDQSIKSWTVPTASALNLSTGTVEEKHPNTATHESLDAHGHLALSDESFIDEDGWMHASRREGAGVLFWVPRENRGGVWWPRNTAVIHKTVTKFDFSRFVHGEHWTECRASESEIESDNVGN